MRVVTPFLVAPMVAVSTVAAVAVEMVRPIEALEQSRRAGIEMEKRMKREEAERRKQEKEKAAQRTRQEAEQRQQEKVERAGQQAQLKHETAAAKAAAKGTGPARRLRDLFDDTGRGPGLAALAQESRRVRRIGAMINRPAGDPEATDA